MSQFWNTMCQRKIVFDKMVLLADMRDKPTEDKIQKLM